MINIFEQIRLSTDDSYSTYKNTKLTRFMKRALDFIFSLTFILIIGSWLFPIIAIIIKLNSKGPVFFLQKRVGLHNSVFFCFKFRTMYMFVDDSVFQATTQYDKRVTKAGQFLRKTNLDELPQIINILIGNMSIIGPRPQPIPFYYNYCEFIEGIDKRHAMKPGLTGWAQVNGLRGDKDDEQENQIWIKKRFKYDMWYINNWSLKLDIYIFFRTLKNFIVGDDNAY
jgi:putative colanic acid biosynthesis UDP-glucose lipid carrier transferase